MIAFSADEITAVPVSAIARLVTFRAVHNYLSNGSRPYNTIPLVSKAGNPRAGNFSFVEAVEDRESRRSGGEQFRRIWTPCLLSKIVCLPKCPCSLS